ncbi:unnamed protein product [Mytilus coruscus]|uniref:Uncharacterized protein n=1 Tax=Mytilus coruscus TaxID=42192 RepID=A0A6J8CFC0_MYTCO|nr:unnamed protein product [Mytilus coruscus]
MYETTLDEYIITLEYSWKRVDASINIALQIKEVKDFIVITNTAKSREDFDKLGLIVDKRVQAVNDTFANMDAVEQKLLESASHQSAKIKKKAKSHSNTGSSSSKRTLRYRSSFDSISSEKEAESAEAEYRVLESKVDTESNFTPEKLKLSGTIDPAGRTTKFVSQQSQFKDTSNIEDVKQ